MSYDRELEDILASIDKDKKRLEDIKNPKPVQMPKKKIEKIEPPKPIEPPAPIEIKEIKIEPRPAIEPIEPPKPIEPPVEKEPIASIDTIIEPPAPIISEKTEEEIAFDNEPIEQKEPRQKILPKIFAGTKAYLKKLFAKEISKKLKIIIVAAVLALVAIIGTTIGVYQANYGYVKPYEKKYSVEYPKGIQKKFLEDYGNDITIRGTIEIKDLDAKRYIYTVQNDNRCYLDKGSSVDAEQQFRSIHLTKKDFDLESIYSTAKGYKKSSQQIDFNTLYNNERYKVIACYYTNKKIDSEVNYVFPYTMYGNMTMQSFAEFQDKIQSRRLYDTGYEFNYFDSFLSLNVDSDFMKDYTFVVVCVKVDGKVKKSNKVTPNEKINYPQSYYDKKDELNPYRFGPKWYPEIYIDDEPCRLTEKSF